ncbi:VP1 [Gokushovirus WZ-2015a]|nr:VP1 [Gokushovirus WZ-2015a]
MNRNTETQFSQMPTKTIPRSKFDHSQSIKFTFNTGDIIPFYVEEILPHDTTNIATNMVIRMATPIYPVMDNAYIDFYYFFVPSRILWEHWKAMNGENEEDYWTQKTEYSVPQLQFDEAVQVGTIADYMGIPVGYKDTNKANRGVNALPFRAYAKIFNDWFRNENTTLPATLSTDDLNRNYNPGDSNTNPQYAELGGLPLKASKFHDYFTSALPAPQKGPAVNISLQNDVPVITGNNIKDWGSEENAQGMRIARNLSGFTGAGQFMLGVQAGRTGEELSQWVGDLRAGQNSATLQENIKVFPANLWAQTSALTATNVNELRMAFAVQRMLELDARSGTRYIEILQAHWGVSSPDARLQRSEYLGGFRKIINISQVLQTSSTDNTSPLGETGAYSLTEEFEKGEFTKSFDEHGYLLGLCVVRTDHTYQQGIEKMWSRKSRFDFYDPIFANIGEQAILNKEIYAQGTDVDDEVFGYQEAWADYRYKPARIAGYFRSGIEGGSLDSWHYADYYSQLPTLSQDWMNETPVNMDRTIAIQSDTSHQLIADVYINNTMVRAMETYSIPGLIDHN